MKPTSEQELSELIIAAKAPFTIKGGGTRMPPLDVAETLEISALSGITLYEPGALTLVAQAGTSIAEIETALSAENQRLAFEPSDLRDVLGTSGASTIGGVAAANASGPRRISVGACRDFMLGVRFVDGTGNVVKNGGRVMKNVTGYDLVKLMSGAHGTLGVLSEVSLKVLPKVEMQLTLRIDGLNAERAVAAMSAALGSPYDVSGAAREVDGAVLLRLEGFEVSVRYRAGELIKRLASFGEITVIDRQSECETLWRDIGDARALAKTTGDLWRVSVKPSDAPLLLETLAPEAAILDWGGGLVWASLARGLDAREAMNVNGHATLMRSGGESSANIARFHTEPAPLAKVSAALRARFDPKGLLNPGLMGDNV